MRPDTAYWKAYWCSYWHIRGNLLNGIAQSEAVSDFLALRFFDNEAKWDIQRLSQQKTAQAA